MKRGYGGQQVLARRPRTLGGIMRGSSHWSVRVWPALGHFEIGRTLKIVALLAGLALPGAADTIYVPSSVCGITDARPALQAFLTTYAGQTIVLPEGATCIITPVANHYQFLQVYAHTTLRGAATIKVADGSAPYTNVFYGWNCTGCVFQDFTIDSNIANNPISGPAEILANPRIEMHLA